MDDVDQPNVIPIDPDLAPSASAGPAVGRPPRPRTWSRRAPPDVLAAISLGGMVGASARYGLARLVPVAAGGFPWATFWTNLSGSLVLGFLLVLLLEWFPPTRCVRPFLATGVLGAYTTFSTFAVETDVLIKDGHAGTAAAYALATLVGGLGAAWAGIVAGRLLTPHGGTRERR